MRLPAMARLFLAIAVFLCALVAGGAVGRAQDTCGPFTDVSALFCPYVLEAYYTGITAGTSPTTFSPDIPITRGQAAVFVSKGLNQALARGSRRAALGQWWTTTPAWNLGLGLTPLGASAHGSASDGADIWVAAGDTVVRVRASDGRVLETWTGATEAWSVLIAAGRIFVAGKFSVPGSLYAIDPTQPAGTVTTVTDELGGTPDQIAFDGSRIWTSNFAGSVSIVTPGASFPWPTTTVSTGLTSPNGIAFDGTSIWVSDAGSLFRLDAAGNIVQTVAIGAWSDTIAFDGTNLYVPTGYPDNAVVVVSAATGTVLKSLVGNGQNGAFSAAFDGQRIIVLSGNAISLWRAADLSPIGSFALDFGLIPSAACSDGLNFWVSLNDAGLGRY